MAIGLTMHGGLLLSDYFKPTTFHAYFVLRLG